MLAPWKKSYDKRRQHIKKQRHYFANKGPSSQSYGFSSGNVWMWELDFKEVCVPKNWCSWTVVLEKTLRVPWTARRSNQSLVKEISPEYTLEGLMLKLKLPILWPPDVTNWLTGKTLMLGKIEGRRRRSRRQEIETHLMDVSLSKFQEMVMDRQSMGLQRVRDDWVTELNWDHLDFRI